MNQIITNAIAALLFFFTLGESVPVVVTRYHTAATHDTVTVTKTTGTTTVTLPVVEIFISNGVTYTYTLYTTATATATGEDASVTSAGTQTVVYTDGTTSTLASGEEVSTSSTAPTTKATSATSTSTSSSSSSSDWTSTTETITLTTTVTLDDGTSSSTATSLSTLTTEKKVVTPDETTTSSSASSSSKVTTTTSSTSKSTSTKATTTSTSKSSTSTKATTTSTSKKATTSSTSSSTSSTSTSASSSSTAEPLSAPYAIVYSPYNNDGTCKNSTVVKSDLELIASKNIPTIRVYGTDCNSISTVEPAAVELGLKINQGFWIDSDGVDSIDDGVTELITWAKANTWDVFDFITIGNEAIQAEYATVDELISKISSVKAKLQAAGYTGSVTTSEPPVIFEENPTLCTGSDIDFVGLNSHSYFDEYSSASEAGTFVAGQIEIVKKICGDLDILITETGYPSSGDTYGLNVPSKANQRIAVASILDVVGTDVTILSTYNDYWKDPGEYGIEQSFGAIQLF